MPVLASVVGPKAIAPKRILTGVVVSAGKMDKCVKVRIAKQRWNKRVHKFYSDPYNILVSDPSSSTRIGDVVAVQNGWRTAKHVRHVIDSIIAPMGPPLDQRPPIPTEVERIAAAEAKRAAKDVRQAARGRQAAQMRVRMRKAEERKLEAAKSAGVNARVRRIEKQTMRSDSLVKKLVEQTKRLGLKDTQTETLGLNAEKDTQTEKLAPNAEKDTQSETGDMSRPGEEPHQEERVVAEQALSAQQQEQVKLDSGEKDLPPSSGLPGGLHPVGKINERAQHNRRKVLKQEAKALKNAKDFEKVGDKIDEQQKKQDESKGWRSWFGG